MLDFFTEYWTFFFMSVALGAAGFFMKNRVFTKRYAAENRVVGFLRYTLLVHAPIAGTLFGLLKAPCPDTIVPGSGEAVLYHCVAGVFSSGLYRAGKAFFKRKVSNL